MRYLLMIGLIFCISAVTAFAEPKDPVTYYCKSSLFGANYYITITLMDTDGDGEWDYYVLCDKRGHNGVIIAEGDLGLVGGETGGVTFNEPSENDYYAEYTVTEQFDGSDRYDMEFYNSDETIHTHSMFVSTNDPLQILYIEQHTVLNRRSEIIENNDIIYTTKVFPQPCSETLSISITESSMAEVEDINIYDQTGRLVVVNSKYEFEKNLYTFDVTSLKAGLYLAYFLNSHHSIKFIVNK
jgi:hypothetical protein